MDDFPDKVMIDTNVQSYVKDDPRLLNTLAKAPIEVYVCVAQDQEIWNRIQEPIDRDNEDREFVIRTLDFDEKANPIVSGVDTSGFGEFFGYNFGGHTGEPYTELLKSAEIIVRTERPDAQGSAAAINCEMSFVTKEKDVIKRVEKYR
jgi:hypothetical protein